MERIKIVINTYADNTAFPGDPVEIIFCRSASDDPVTYGGCTSTEINRLARRSKKESPLRFLNKELKSQDVKRRRFAKWALDAIGYQLASQASLTLRDLSGVSCWAE